MKTGIRANYLGAGSLLHTVTEFFIGLAMPSPRTYAERVVHLLVAPELEGRSGSLFGSKGQPILPSDGMTPEGVQALIAASSALVARAQATAA